MPLPKHGVAPPPNIYTLHSDEEGDLQDDESEEGSLSGDQVTQILFTSI